MLLADDEQLDDLRRKKGAKGQLKPRPFDFDA